MLLKRKIGGRQKRSHPTATIKPRGEAWQVYWSRDRKAYRLTLPIASEAQRQVMLAEINLALTGGPWPDWTLSCTPIMRYRQEIGELAAYAKSPSRIARSVMLKDADLIDEYQGHLHLNKPTGTAKNLASRVRELSTWAKVPLTKLTRKDARDFLDHILKSGAPHCGRVAQITEHTKPGEVYTAKTLHARFIAAGLAGETASEYDRLRHALRERPDFFEPLTGPDGRRVRGHYLRLPTPEATRSHETRNRAQSQLSVFSKWMVQSGHWPENLFSGLGYKARRKPAEIIYCTEEERQAIIEAAEALSYPDAMAVKLAFFTGMRRGEISRVRWADIVQGRIKVGFADATKTGDNRLVPIFGSMRDILDAVPKNKKRGLIVPWAEDYKSAAKDLLANLKKALPELAKEKKLGFNAWRHTFCSLLAQSGMVTLDQIGAWAGHDAETCRQHYAQFVPENLPDHIAGLL